MHHCVDLRAKTAQLTAAMLCFSQKIMAGATPVLNNSILYWEELKEPR